MCVMFMITIVIKPCMGKLILYNLIENNCPEFCNSLFIVLQKIPAVWNQTFKHNLAHMPSLNLSFFLNLGFVYSSLTVTTQKHVYSLYSLFCLFYHQYYLKIHRIFCYFFVLCINIYQLFVFLSIFSLGWPFKICQRAIPA